MFNPVPPHQLTSLLQRARSHTSNNPNSITQNTTAHTTAHTAKQSHRNPPPSLQTSLAPLLPPPSLLELLYLYDSSPSGHGYFLLCNSGTMYHLWRQGLLQHHHPNPNQPTCYAPTASLAFTLSCPPHQLFASYKHAYDSWARLHLFRSPQQLAIFVRNHGVLYSEGLFIGYRPSLHARVSRAREIVMATGNVSAALKVLELREEWEEEGEVGEGVEAASRAPGLDGRSVGGGVEGVKAPVLVDSVFFADEVCEVVRRGREPPRGATVCPKEIEDRGTRPWWM